MEEDDGRHRPSDPELLPCARRVAAPAPARLPGESRPARRRLAGGTRARRAWRIPAAAVRLARLVARRRAGRLVGAAPRRAPIRLAPTLEGATARVERVPAGARRSARDRAGLEDHDRAGKGHSRPRTRRQPRASLHGAPQGGPRLRNEAAGPRRTRRCLSERGGGGPDEPAQLAIPL